MSEKKPSTEIIERLLMEGLKGLDASAEAELIKYLTNQLVLCERGKICKAMKKEEDNFFRFDNGWTYEQ